MDEFQSFGHHFRVRDLGERYCDRSIINFLKLPLGAGLNLITPGSLLTNLILAPVIALGVFGGHRLIKIISQRAFEATVITFAFLAGVRLCFF